MPDNRKPRTVTHNGRTYTIQPVRTRWWDAIDDRGQLVAAGPNLAWTTRELVRVTATPACPGESHAAEQRRISASATAQSPLARRDPTGDPGSGGRAGRLPEDAGSTTKRSRIMIRHYYLLDSLASSHRSPCRSGIRQLAEAMPKGDYWIDEVEAHERARNSATPAGSTSR